MTVASRQAKGSGSQVLLDLENGFKTARTGSAKKPTRLAFMSSGLQKTVALEQSNVITSDRNPAQPREGAINTGGDVVAPIDKTQIGYLLRGVVGAPNSKETPTADNKSGSPTVTISGGSGAYTFSGAQASAAEGDRVILEKNGVRTVVYLTTVTNSTTGVMSKERDAATAADDITAATVVAIIPNQAESTPGDLTITSGVLTFGTTQTNAAAGMQVIYATNQRAILVADQGSDAWTVVDGVGRTPADAGTSDLEALEAQSRYTHTFEIDPIASLSSFIVEHGHLDLVVPYCQHFFGVKFNQMRLEVTPDGELQATLSSIGANMRKSYLPYDRASKMTGSPTISISSGTATFSAAQGSAAVGDIVIYTPTGATKASVCYLTTENSDTEFVVQDENGDAPSDVTGATVEAIWTPGDANRSSVSLYGEIFNPRDASIKIGGTTSEIVTRFQIDFQNAAQGTKTIFNGGESRHIPEGTVVAQGQIEALFEDEELLRIADDKLPTSFELRFDHGGESLSFLYSRIEIQSTTPPISDGGGLRISADWFGYKPAGGVSALIATLVNEHEHYN